MSSPSTNEYSWFDEAIVLMDSNQIREINASRKGLDVSRSRNLAVSLVQNTSLQILDLSWNGLSSECTKNLALALYKNATLKYLNLNSNSIDLDGARIIADLLLHNKGLTCLKLSWNQIMDEGARLLAMSLTPHTNSTGISLYNKTLAILELGCNSIHEEGAKALFNAVRLNPTLTELNLEWNEIPDEILRHGLPAAVQTNGLRKINLYRNDSMSSDTIKSLAASLMSNSSLESLSLSGKFGDSGCKYLSPCLSRPIILNHLYLNKCKIGDEGVKYLTNGLLANITLVLLHLSANKIRDEGAKAFQILLESNITLTDLDLSVNKISDVGVISLANSLRVNFTLIHLNLQQNDFADDGKRALENALTVNYSLIELKGAVSTRLTSYTRQKNSVSTTEHKWSNLGLTTWPLSETEYLGLKSGNEKPVGNIISSYPSFTPTTLGAITSLILHNNRIKEIPSVFLQLTNLRTLVFSKNELVSLNSTLSYHTSLTLLDLRKNHLESLPSEIASLKLLSILNVGYNRLTTLPPSLENCKSLTELHLRDNKLDVLPSQMTKLTELKLFDLRNNPLKFILESVVPSKGALLNTKQQLEKLWAYLISLSDGTPFKLSRVKLMLVGDANVGKTSLRKFLTAGEKIQSGTHTNVTTDGIDMHDISTKKSSIIFTAYDFAGQELYYTTHQFFLSDKAIYLVVFSFSRLISLISTDSHNRQDNSSGNKSLGGRTLLRRKTSTLSQAQPLGQNNSTTPTVTNSSFSSLEYWLKSIRLRAPYAPIILVGTHLDEIGKEMAEEILIQLKSKLKNYKIEEFFAVSTVKRSEGNSSLSSIKDKTFSTFCGVGSNTMDLIPYLTNLAEQRRLGGQTVPYSCSRVIEFIEEFRRTNPSPIMLLEDFNKVMVGFNITNTSYIISLLSSMGYLLYYEHDLSLRNVVILNPQFLANLMSSVVTLKSNNVREGKLSISHFIEAYVSSKNNENLQPPQQLIHNNTNNSIFMDHMSKLVVLLEKFEVLFRLPSTNPSSLHSNVLVPCMLPSNDPDEFKFVIERVESWEMPPSFIHFKRIYNFKFMPFGFFSRLIVRILNFKSEVHCWGLWRDGICFQDMNTVTNDSQGDFGYLLYDEVSQSLTFSMVSSPLRLSSLSKQNNCPTPLSLLQRIAQGIDSLIEVFYSRETQAFAIENKAAVDVQIICPHCRKTGSKSPNSNVTSSDNNYTQFNLNDLLLHFLSGEYFEYCSISNEKTKIPLVDLIPDLIMSHLPVLDSIQTLEQIGEGGFGKVYRGIWKNVQVAIKELKNFEEWETDTNTNPKSENTNEFSINRWKAFHHEVFIMSSFNHPNLVQMFGIAINPLRIIMEYIPNSSLTEVLHHSSTWSNVSLRQKLFVALDISKGLECLHSVVPPIVHRDLRSQNIFIESLNEDAPIHAKVGDFGLSQHAFTGLKQYLGDFLWLAPEVLRNDSSYSCESDVYSFAIILWELLSGQVPFSEFEQFVTIRVETLSEKDLADSALMLNFSRLGYIVQGNKLTIQTFKQQELLEAIVSKNLRPSIPDNVPQEIAQLLTSCWDSILKNRPTFTAISNTLANYLFNNDASEIENYYQRATRIAETLVSTSNHTSRHAVLKSISNDVPLNLFSKKSGSKSSKKTQPLEKNQKLSKRQSDKPALPQFRQRDDRPKKAAPVPTSYNRVAPSQAQESLNKQIIPQSENLKTSIAHRRKANAVLPEWQNSSSPALIVPISFQFDSVILCAASISATNEVWLYDKSGSQILICDNNFEQSSFIDLNQTEMVTQMKSHGELVWVLSQRYEPLSDDKTNNCLIRIYHSENRNEIGQLKWSSLRENELITCFSTATMHSNAIGVWAGYNSGIVNHWISNSGSISVEPQMSVQVSSQSPISAITVIHRSKSTSNNSSKFRQSRLGGSVWVASQNRISVFDLDSFELIVEIEAHSPSSIIKSIIHIGNNVWTCASDGVKVWNTNTCEFINHVWKDKVSIGFKIVVSSLDLLPQVQSIDIIDSVQHLWVFTQDNKILVFDGNTYEKLVEAHTGMESPIIHAMNSASNRIMIMDSKGSIGLWMYKRPTKRAPLPPSQHQSR